jgi:hypothetical protein
MLLNLAGGAEHGPGAVATLTLEPRMEVPHGVFGHYAFGIVRRGLIIRERIDAEGARTAVDVAGRGAYVPLDRAQGYAGYAASRTLLCVYREAALEEMSAQAECGMDLMKLARETLERVERIADARGRPSAAERIDALCEMLRECVGAHAEDLLQRDFAALLGMRTETVCRIMRVRQGRR